MEDGSDGRCEKELEFQHVFLLPFFFPLVVCGY